jgi:hypothetical protein
MRLERTATATQKVFPGLRIRMFIIVDIHVRAVCYSQPAIRISHRTKTAQHTEQTAIHKIHGFTSKQKGKIHPTTGHEGPERGVAV